MLHRWMTERERGDLVGKLVTFTVIRDGRPVERTQTITRVTQTVIWCGAYCYSRDEPQNLREATW